MPTQGQPIWVCIPHGSAKPGVFIGRHGADCIVRLDGSSFDIPVPCSSIVTSERDCGGVENSAERLSPRFPGFLQPSLDQRRYTGMDVLESARYALGHDYGHGVVPKDQNEWPGPWDCAELASWAIFQVLGQLYGCLDNRASPSVADAYTGSWARDSRDLGHRIDLHEAISTPGVVLLRAPIGPARMGHIAISDGQGGTVEAHSEEFKVTDQKSSQRRPWDYGVLVPGIEYTSLEQIDFYPPSYVYGLNRPNMRTAVIEAIQAKLREKGFLPPQDDGGYFGPNTAAAVFSFQEQHAELVADGLVGLETAEHLGVDLLG